MTEQQLNAERERIAELLFKASYLDPNHKTLEAQFNAIEKDLFVHKGGLANDYRYKHDVRHYFEFREVRDATGLREQIAATKQGRTLLPTAEVINWRNTKAGGDEDNRARRAVRRNRLDDAGHLIALEFGTNPSDQRNLADQNFIQNETGTWRREEAALAEWLDTHTACTIHVTVFYNQDNFGRRNFYRKMEVNGSDLQGRGVAFHDNVVYGNFQSQAGSRAAGWGHNRQILDALKNPVYPPTLRPVK